MLKSPYYAGRGIYRLAKRAEVRSAEREVERTRGRMSANHDDFKMLKVFDGDFAQLEEELLKEESKIGIILGARGSGKTAFGLKLLENIYATDKSRCYALGFKKSEMPAWIEVVEDISEIKNDATVLIDEGGILFSSRESMSKPNKLLSDLILISRHKNLNILFITQNSSNLDVNIIRQADFLALKPTSLLQKDFERKKIKDIYEEVAREFEKFKDDRGATYIYSEEFRGFVSNPLPSFWNTRISKSFRGAKQGQ